MMNRKELLKCSQFVREYADTAYNINLNKIKLSKDNTIFHNMRVCEICCNLIKHWDSFLHRA